MLCKQFLVETGLEGEGFTFSFMFTLILAKRDLSSLLFEVIDWFAGLIEERQ